jgi:hypothetical protein
MGVVVVPKKSSPLESAFANLVGSLIQAGVAQGMQGQENKAFADLVRALGQEANRQPLPEPVFSGGGAQGVQEDFMAPMAAAMGRVMGLSGGEGWKENVWDRTAGRPAPTDALALFNTAAAHGKVRPEEQANLLRFVGEQLAARNEASALAGMNAARNAWADGAGGLDLNDPNAAFGHLARSLPLFGPEGAAQARQMLEHVRPHQGFQQVDLGDRVDVVAQDPWSGTARRAYGGEKGVPAETRFREGAQDRRARIPDGQIVEMDGRQALVDRKTGRVLQDLGPAPERASKPQYRTVNGTVLRIDEQGATPVYSDPQGEKQISRADADAIAREVFGGTDPIGRFTAGIVNSKMTPEEAEAYLRQRYEGNPDALRYAQGLLFGISTTQTGKNPFFRGGGGEKPADATPAQGVSKGAGSTAGGRGELVAARVRQALEQGIPPENILGDAERTGDAELVTLVRQALGSAKGR